MRYERRKRAAWKTERKESRDACWALRRPMMSFSLTKQEEFFLCFCAEKNVIGLIFIFKRKGFDMDNQTFFNRAILWTSAIFL
ncbi:hypothetical protein AWH49_17200 [Domibacillus aminovorans]|uniref:Uncharacterized protein n=1 Tax=Domibacillus aminovorans TaxID=29332 RepID=A0A177L4F0_9BACI|nr:hypothetical protein AWH49_17200 [Domibacillus aminovorans]